MMLGGGRFAALMMLLSLCASCDPTEMRAWELAGEPGLLFQVQQHYERNALEEGGRCTAPLLQGVTRTEMLEDTPEQMVLRLKYSFRDRIRDGGSCSDRRRGRCGMMRECRGFAQRTFTIARTDDGLEVVGMSGAQRNRRQRSL
jgi:hypothetical protein